MNRKIKGDGIIYAGTSGDFAEDLFRKPSAKKKTVLLRVVGDSMTGDEIHPGDRVRIRLSNFALPGTICAIQTPYGPVLKRFDPRSENVLLWSSNPNYKPQLWLGSELRIIGIVVAVLK